MRNVFTCFIGCLLLGQVQAQNVGIGTSSPFNKLHVNANSDSLLLLENLQPLGTGISNNIHFKIGGGLYTGGIRMIGQGTTEARLGFFTNTSATAGGLLERLSILNNGFTGIGTSSPVTKLHINGSEAMPSLPGSTSTGILRIGAGDGNGIDIGKMGGGSFAGWIQAGFDGTFADPLSLQPAGGSVGIGTTEPGNIFSVAGNADFSGNVGIGTSSPSYPLHLVNGGGYGFIHSVNDVELGTWVDQEGGWIGTKSNHPLKFFTNNSEGQMILLPSGNFGIGTTNPTNKLSVDGSSNFSGNMGIGENIFTNARMRVHSGSNEFGMYLEGNSATTAALYALGKIVFIGNLGLGTNTANAPLQFGNNLTNRKIVLYDDTNNDHEFNGFGTNAGILRYQINRPTESHVFYAGSSSTTSNELARFAGTGRTTFNIRQQQVVINGTASGNPTNFWDAYPLLVQGSQQGIAVKINSDQAHEGNNYMYFSDNIFTRGSIAGQNLAELQSSFDYIWFNSMKALEESFILAEGIACAAQLDLGEAGVMAVEGALIYAEWAEALINMQNSVGVVYQSNAADYAEWLERVDPREDLAPGMIVGVNGGRISKTTQGIKQFMVISTSPLVLGNTPPKGHEQAYEKVAFMGQVPVRVRGIVRTGDYILASGLNDGVGIAVSPEKMQLNDYDRVVGVAWSSSMARNTESLINTAVGLNTHDLVGEIRKQKEEVLELKKTLNSVISYLQQKDPAFKLASSGTHQVAVPDEFKSSQNSVITKKDFSIGNVAELSALLKQNPQYVDQLLANARKICESRGMDMSNPNTKMLFDRSTFFERLDEAVSSPSRSRNNPKPR